MLEIIYYCNCCKIIVKDQVKTCNCDDIIVGDVSQQIT
jgi:hypothetical protein